MPRAFLGDPSWSPTGKSLAVDYAASGGAYNELAIVNLSSAQEPLGIVGVASATQPAWSPDGSRIAFVCSWTAEFASLCVVNRDGSGLVQLTDDATVDRNPAWSPDGTIIAFRRYPVGEQSPIERSDPSAADLDLMNVVTREIRTLTKGGDPAWSPDGSKLVYAGGDGLFIIDADGTNRRRLTIGAHYEPAWRP